MKKVDLDQLWRDYKPMYPRYTAKLSNGETCGYTEFGSGPITVVAIHGGWACSEAMIPYMKVLGKTMRVIAPCLRGFGYSSYNKPMTGCDDLANDIVLLIKEHLKLKEFYLLGHSMGTTVSCYIAIELGEMC